MLRVTVRTREVEAALRKMRLKPRDLAAAWDRIGAAIKVTAVPLAPVGVTGRLVKSIRQGKAKTQAIVRAGSKPVPYAGVINYGWPARNITPVHFLNDALEANRSRAVDEVHDEINTIARRAGLNIK